MSILSEFISTLWWSIKKWVQISPKLFILMFFTRCFSVLSPIAITFISSQILGKIVLMLSSHKTNIDSTMGYFFIILIILSLLSGVTSDGYEYLFMRYNYRFDEFIWSEYLQLLVNLDIKYQEDSEVQTNLKRIEEALNNTLRQSFYAFINLFTQILGFVTLIGTFSFINSLFLIAIFIPVLLSYYLNKVYGRTVYSIWSSKGEQKKLVRKALNGLSEIDKIQEAKIYSFGTYLVNKYLDYQKEFITEVRSKMDKKYFFQIILGIFDTLIFIAIQIWIIMQTLQRNISISSYSFYLSNLQSLSNRLNSIQNSFSTILEYSQYNKDLKEFYLLPKYIIESSNPIKLEQMPPSIEFKNVSFKYPNSDKYIFKDISFKVNSGEKIALVGANGVGKSTLIKLIARFYDVSDGEILINGINIKNIDLKSYYKLWGVLFQNFAKYWFSLKENIGIGNLEYINDEERILKAGKKAGVDEIAKKLKFGYDNFLSNDLKYGKSLSGGEWQKVGIARSLFSEPKLIVLDEPTSALDSLAEAAIFEQLEKLSGLSTVIIVSHRFATVRNANRIIVLEEGLIKEEGSHEELIQNNGLYYKMFTTQAQGYL